MDTESNRNIHFERVVSDEPVAEHIASAISKHLKAGETVSWFLSGGSAIQLAVKVSAALHGTDAGKLSISLIDERHGPAGHADSNWKQLQDAGFSVADARLIPVLDGSDLPSTAEHFSATVADLLQADYKIAILGIGPDGHTAGILPGTEAVTAKGLVVGYKTDQHNRVTMTVQALEQLNEAVVYAMGEAKKPTLQQLRDQDVPLDQQPAQLLKHITNVTIFNDQIGD